MKFKSINTLYVQRHVSYEEIKVNQGKTMVQAMIVYELTPVQTNFDTHFKTKREPNSSYELE